MPVIKCKYCCSPIEYVLGIWKDDGMFMQGTCLSSPTRLHEPMDKEDEAVDESITEDEVADESITEDEV